MSFIAAIAGLASAGVAIYNAGESKNAAEDARIEQERVRAEMAKHKAEYAKLDTSNPYLGMQNMYDNMENMMEDLTVNQQAADFQRQQQMQSQANIMQSMRGAAGSSGIAALAQTLANQGALDAQQTSAMIGEQEAANIKARAEEASRIQDLQLGEDIRIAGLEREGELKSRQMEADKIGTMLGLASADMAGYQALEQAAITGQAANIQAATSGAEVAGSSINTWIENQ